MINQIYVIKILIQNILHHFFLTKADHIETKLK